MPMATFAQKVTYAPNEVLVKFKSGAVPFSAKMAVGGVTLNTLREINVERIRVTGMSAEQALKVFKNDPNVAYAELNYKDQPFYTPNDPRLGQQYGIDQVKAKQAWDISKGSSNTVISVIDSGLRLTHEEFVGRIAPGGYDWSDNDGDVTDNTGSGHGTHCTGIAIAATDNGKGVASVSFNGKILPMKIFPNSTKAVSSSAIIDAANKGARVISMSFGSAANSQVQQDAINYAWNKGVVLFAAAGNDGNTVKNFPAGCDNTISVAATNSADQRAGFSTYGDWVNIAAPGEDIMSTVFDGDNTYALNSGTSMACPFAASVAGLMIGRNPAITNVEVRNIIFTTCDNVGNFIQKGRINAFKAIQKVFTPLPFTGTPVSASVGVVGGSTEGAQIGTYGSPATAGQVIKSADGSIFSIQSVKNAKLGTVAALDTYVLVGPSASNIMSATVSFTGRSADSSSALIFVFNNTTGAWDQLGSMSMSSVNKSVSLNIPIANLPNYLNGGNMVRLMVRNILPLRVNAAGGYILKVDQFNVSGTSKASA
jgi:thermitase